MKPKKEKPERVWESMMNRNNPTVTGACEIDIKWIEKLTDAKLYEIIGRLYVDGLCDENKKLVLEGKETK